jgi:hypothetical protein
MNAHSGELGGRESRKRGVVPSGRWLALVAVVVAAGLGAGFATGSLIKGGGNAHRPTSALAPGASNHSTPAPVVLTVRASGALPSLRRRPKPPPASPSVAAASAPRAVPSSATSSAPASTSTPSPSVSPSSSTSAAPKQTAPTHSGGGEVHHESGGGA